MARKKRNRVKKNPNLVSNSCTAQIRPQQPPPPAQNWLAHSNMYTSNPQNLGTNPRPRTFFTIGEKPSNVSAVVNQRPRSFFSIRAPTHANAKPPKSKPAILRRKPADNGSLSRPPRSFLDRPHLRPVPNWSPLTLGLIGHQPYKGIQKP